MEQFENELYHYGRSKRDGAPIGSGRYPLGSGKDGQLINTYNGKIIERKDGSKIFKNFTFNRVGASLQDSTSGGTYVSYGKLDANRYIAAMGPNLLGRLLKTAQFTSLKINTIQDLYMPSNEYMTKVIADFCINNPDFVEKLDESVSSMFMDNGGTVSEIKRCAYAALKNPNSREADQLRFSVFHMIGDDQYHKWSKKLYEKCINDGYDIIPDYADRMTGVASTASIIINRDKVKISEKKHLSKYDAKDAKQFCRPYRIRSVYDFL